MLGDLTFFSWDSSISFVGSRDPLVNVYITMILWKITIEIVDLSINGDFPVIYLSHYQRVRVEL